MARGHGGNHLKTSTRRYLGGSTSGTIGTRNHGKGKPVKQSDPDRRCAYVDCGTVLSRYNHMPTCRVHEDLEYALKMFFRTAGQIFN